MKKLFALLLVTVMSMSVPVMAAQNDYNGNGYNGYENGYSNGNNGYENGYNNGYENGYSNGYGSYEDSHYNGYEGYENGYGNGYNGYENGRNGYNNGYGQTYERPLNYYPQLQPVSEPSTAYVQPGTVSLTEALNRVYWDSFMKDNTKMVPLRQVAEAVGFRVTWNEAHRSVTLQHVGGQAVATLVIGQERSNGHVLDVAPTIRNDRTFVPVSFFEGLLAR